MPWEIYARLTMIRRFLDWLFGYDFFISYGHDDGIAYPHSLHDALSSRQPRFSVFLDKKDYTAGEDLDAATKRRVRMSKHLVVVCGPKALASKWVKREVEVFLGKGRVPIAIDVNDVLQADANAEWLRQVLGQALTVRETVTNPQEGPSDATIQQLVQSFTSWRVAKVRFWVLTISLIAFLALAVGGAGSYWNATVQRDINHATALSAAALAELPHDPQRALELAACSVQTESLPAGSTALTRALTTTWGVERFLAGHSRPVRDAAFFPDAQALVTTGDDRRVIIWDLETGAQRASITIGEDQNFSLAVDRTGERILIGDGVGNLHVWRHRGAASGGAVTKRKLHDEWITAIATVGGDLIATASRDNTIRLYDLKAGDVLCTVRDAHGYTVNTRTRWISTLVYEERSRRLFSGGSDGKIRSWNLLDPSRCISAGAVADHGSELESLAVSPDGRLLASGGQNGNAKIWKVRGGGIDGADAGGLDLERDKERLGVLSFSADSRLLAAGYWDGTAELWDLGDGVLEDDKPLFLYRNRLHGGPVNSVRFAPAGGRLASTGQDGSVVLWNLEQALQVARPLSLDYSEYSSSALSPAASFAVSWKYGNSITVRSMLLKSPSTSLVVKEYVEAWNSSIDITHGVSAAAVSSDGRYIALGYANGPFQILEVPSGRVIVEDIAAHGEEVTAIEWSLSEPRRIVSGAGDGTVFLWSPGPAGWEKKQVFRHEGGVSALAISEDGRFTASAGNMVAPGFEAIQVWTTEPLRRVDEFGTDDPDTGVTWALALDGLNQRVIRATDSGEILLRDFGKHLDLSPLPRPGGEVSALAIDQTGQYLATGTRDGRIKIWRIADGQQAAELATLPHGARSGVDGLRFLPSGKGLASANGGRVVLWNFDEAELLAYARKLVTGSSSTDLSCL